jgi:hypothetical protein
MLREHHRLRCLRTLVGGGKWLELLSEIAPGLKRVAIMFNPDVFPASTYIPSLEAAARSLKVVPIIAPVHSDVEIETAIIALGREPGGGFVAVPDLFMLAHRAAIILAAARHNVPAIYTVSEAARDGGLLSYARGRRGRRIRCLGARTRDRSSLDAAPCARQTGEGFRDKAVALKLARHGFSR